MKISDTKPAPQGEGIDISKVTFDEDGKSSVLSDDELDGMSGGQNMSPNCICPESSFPNGNCEAE